MKHSRTSAEKQPLSRYRYAKDAVMLVKGLLITDKTQRHKTQRQIKALVSLETENPAAL